MVRMVVDGISGGSAITISPDGQRLYVAGMVDDAVAVFGEIKVFLPLVIKN